MNKFNFEDIDWTRKEYSTEGLPKLEVCYADVLTRPLFYPNNQFTFALAKLMRRQSFTRSEIEMLRRIGFEVTISVRQVELPENIK